MPVADLTRDDKPILIATDCLVRVAESSPRVAKVVKCMAFAITVTEITSDN